MKVASDIVDELYNNDIQKFDGMVYNAIKTNLSNISYTLDDNRFKARFEADLTRSGFPFVVNPLLPGIYSIDLSTLDFGDPITSSHI